MGIVVPIAARGSTGAGAFVAGVIERQEKERLSGNRLAKKLGLDPSHYAHVRRGTKPVTLTFIRCVLREWPELAILLPAELWPELFPHPFGRRPGDRPA